MFLLFLTEKKLIKFQGEVDESKKHKLQGNTQF